MKRDLGWTNLDIVNCSCGRTVRRTYPGQTQCFNCQADSSDTAPPVIKLDTIRLFIPPSANDLWEGTGKACSRTAAYNAWREKHRDDVRKTFAWVRPPIATFITIFGGNGFILSRDADNCQKPVQDLLVYARVIPDDTVAYVKEFGGRYVEANKGDVAHLELRVLEVRR